MGSMMPRIRIPRPFAAALTLMLGVSCADPLMTCACSPVPPMAVLYGRVTDAAGNPVPNATVRAQNGPPGCQPFANDAGAAGTDADGRYRAEIYGPGGPVECLRAFALAPAGFNLRGSDTVDFRVTFAVRHPLDSTRVDLVLRAP
jgi:hypothetical protein